MKVRDIIKKLEAEGWYMARQSGSHKIKVVVIRFLKTRINQTYE